MNHTHCRTTAADFSVDPILIPAKTRPTSPPRTGYLVGAYCMEEEYITTRRLHFPNGVAAGDLIAFPNTAGYLMHFLESRSHQFDLPKNLILGKDSNGVLDPIDQS